MTAIRQNHLVQGSKQIPHSSSLSKSTLASLPSPSNLFLQKLSAHRFFFIVLKTILRMKQTPENTGKWFTENFSEMQPNTVKYFTEIILHKIFYGETNRPVSQA
jgi:hypothetical protein